MNQLESDARTNMRRCAQMYCYHVSLLSVPERTVSGTSARVAAAAYWLARAKHWRDLNHRRGGV